MSHPAITVENLSKAYRIGVQTERADSLVSALRGVAAAPFQNWNRLRKLNTYGNHADADDLHWALRDVSFDVPEGEVLGVIGRNGAGKSTLLKILSRITEPTCGRATIRGRVSSLLEVGTGFHPELSGRENIYLNGTILGMRKREIDRKLDQIIDFAGVEKFLDTPVKRYSSGMKVRLAFAVAAHLEPEILIIDEVLAVGDAQFQNKCMGKMHDVADGGRTVLFVSHNMPAVESLCGRAIVIVDGRIALSDSPKAAIEEYLRINKDAVESLGGSAESRCGTVELRSAELDVTEGDLAIDIEAHVRERFPVIGVGFEIRTERGTRVATQGAIHNGVYLSNIKGDLRIRLRLLDLVASLTGGSYEIDVWLSRPGAEKLVGLSPAGRFVIPGKDPTASGHALYADKNGPLFVRVAAEMPTE